MTRPVFDKACLILRQSRQVREGLKYGMGSRKYMGPNRWKRARKGLLHKERWDSAGNPELTGCFGTI